MSRLAGDCLPALPFALLPVYTALSTLAPSLPPEPLILARVVLVVAFLTSLLCIMLIAAGLSSRAAGSGVALAACVFSLYPLAKRLFVGTGDLSPSVFAISYLVVCAAPLMAMARFRPSAVAILYDTTRIASVALTIWFGAYGWMYYGRPAGREAVGNTEPDGLHSIVSRDSSRGMPDVYHVILDGFGRPDVLRAMYGLDLSGLLRGLEERGFEVDGSRGVANYTQTYLSLASMLNANYLDALGIPASDAHSRVPAHELIQQSSVIRAFKRLGYRIHVVGSIYSATRQHALADECACGYPLVGEFESAVALSTPFGDTGFRGFDYRPHRNKLQQTFETLESIGPSSEPRFLLAHLMAPHPPFVFDAQGNDVSPARAFSLFDGDMYRGTLTEYTEGYRNQARYVAARLLRAIDRFRDASRQSSRDFVVIVHGDHGPRARFSAADAAETDAGESVPVLLAIRWSGGQRGAPVPAVGSLVNIYRAFFRQYFNAGLEPLPDRAFVSSFMRPYRLREVDPEALSNDGGGIAPR